MNRLIEKMKTHTYFSSYYCQTNCLKSNGYITFFWDPFGIAEQIAQVKTDLHKCRVGILLRR